MQALQLSRFVVRPEQTVRDAMRVITDNFREFALVAAADLQVVGEAGSAEEALQQLREGLKVDVVVLDITLPGQSGIDLLKQLRRDRPELAILVLSMHPERSFAVRLMRAGANGYVPKMIVPEVGGKNPLIKLKKVVFPAPFGPMIAHSSPLATVSETSRTATRLPKRLVTLLISSTFTPCSVAGNQAIRAGRTARPGQRAVRRTTSSSP